MPEAAKPILDTRYPRVFGRFVLLECLGEGGMGRVYRAVLTGPGGFRKAVALKVLLPRGPDEEHAGIYASSIRNEARLGALLRHPGLVEVYDHGLCDGVPWIAMELVEGVDLDVILRREAPLSPSAVIDLGLQLCSALNYAHAFKDGSREVNLVHRDLKPANVLVDHYGRIKITDLGIAWSELATVATTAEGLLKGTPTFIAPEQIVGSAVDGRADLFAVGAILFEAITGKRLFRRGSASATVAAVLACDELLLEGDDMELADAALPGFGDVLRGCLWRDPDVRYSTASVLAEALLELSFQATMLEGDELDLAGLSRQVTAHKQWSRKTVVSPDRIPIGVTSDSHPFPVPSDPFQADAVEAILAGQGRRAPMALPEVEPMLMSRTRIRAVGFDDKAAPSRLPALRARGAEGLLVAILALLVAMSGPFGEPPTESETAPDVQAIPMTFVGPLLADAGPAEAPEPPALEELHLPAPITVEPPSVRAPQLPITFVAPAPARHSRIISRARVGTSRSFIVESPDQPLARVRLFLRTGDGPWRHEPMSWVAEGYWGAVVHFEAASTGTLAYWFEVQPADGDSYGLGSADAPWLVDVQQ